ncbi:hypothetical protein F5Y17DRAFT_449276 [Xylariaceae sp. FL0594]|nr:hypothetical protein F5Y17DRAFT_449276 [Xylariaceae sp. FL0594]
MVLTRQLVPWQKTNITPTGLLLAIDPINVPSGGPTRISFFLDFRVAIVQPLHARDYTSTVEKRTTSLAHVWPLNHVPSDSSRLQDRLNSLRTSDWRASLTMPRKKNSPKAKKGRAKARARARANPPAQPAHHETAGNRDGAQFHRSHGYTLAEEARNTASNRRGNRGRDARLRHQPVAFVSAGFMDPLKLLTTPDMAEQLIPPVEAAASPSEVGTRVVDTPDARELEDFRGRLSDVGRTAPSEQPRFPTYSSDSSEEVILFRGRNAGGRQAEPLSSPPTNSHVLEPVDVDLPLQAADRMAKVAAHSDTPTRAQEPDYIAFEEPRRRRPRRLRRPRRSTSRKRQPLATCGDDDDDDEAAFIADYIANMRQGLEDDEDSARGSTDREGGERHGIGAHGFNILRDLGGTDSDAIPSQASSGEEFTGGSDDEQSFESADERLARLIARREELGVETDDVLNSVLSDEDGEDDEARWLPATRAPLRHGKGKAALRKRKPFLKGSQYPSATEMAEAFDAMDLMDLQNARMQRSKNGPLSFGLSDSELESAMNAAIQKDRLKKADRKKAREKLRSEGLLGKNVNPDDLRVKYRAGMSLDELAEELETFLLSTREQLILPPFDKHARVVVHTIAHSLRIKSKSAGDGTGRHPVLYRTKATLSYNRDQLNRAFSCTRRTWFPRVDADRSVVQEARVLKAAEISNRVRHNGRSSLILREGEVVGQHAAELGVENKGRAMLEKMGWSKGMSLGTGETKGIIVPLMHVVKKTKAGLGEA